MFFSNKIWLDPQSIEVGLKCVSGAQVEEDIVQRPATNPARQEALIRDACDRGGLRAQDISTVELHGTGTRLGDPVEPRGRTLNPVS